MDVKQRERERKKMRGIHNRNRPRRPPLLILYLFYNTDILETPINQVSEDAIGYVNNVAMITIGNNLTETTTRLKSIMTRNKEGLEWSRSHNSKFEVNKSTIIHFSRKTILDPANNTRILLPRSKLVLEGQTVKETKNYKYLGIIIDNQLTWKEQTQRLTANTTSWILQFRRLTKFIKLLVLQWLDTKYTGYSYIPPT